VRPWTAALSPLDHADGFIVVHRVYPQRARPKITTKEHDQGARPGKPGGVVAFIRDVTQVPDGVGCVGAWPFHTGVTQVSDAVGFVGGWLPVRALALRECWCVVARHGRCYSSVRRSRIC